MPARFKIQLCRRESFFVLRGVALVGVVWLYVLLVISDGILLNYSDMYYYLRIVEDMANGEFSLFATKTRTNLFPLLLYGWLEFFGYSLESIRFFYLVCITIVSVQALILGSLLFNFISGVLSCFFVLTSFTFLHFVYFPHIDLVLLLFINFSLITIALALKFKERELYFFLLSGIFIGFSLLIKESAIWLVFLLPFYFLLEKRKLSSKCTCLFVQLIPFLSVFFCILAFSGKDFFVRYLTKINRIIDTLMSGDNVLVNAQHAGWAAYGLDHLFPWVKAFLFFFFPIFWQWENLVPVPRILIVCEQAVLFFSFFIFLRKKSEAKLFICSALLVFFPRFLYVAIAGAKLRQSLPFFYIFYLPLGYIFFLTFVKL